MSPPEEPPPPPPAVELQPDDQQSPNESDLSVPDYPPPPVLELIYDAVLEDQIYDEPTPDPASAGPQPETNLNLSSPVNVVSHSEDNSVSNYFANAISKPAYPTPPPPPAKLQLQNQPCPGYPVAQPGQCISTYPVGGQEVPGAAPLPAGFQPNNQPVTIQSGTSNQAPQPVQPYSAPAVPPMISTGIPPGLEYLNQVDQVLIHQKIECVKILSGFEPSNEYDIKNSIGEKVFNVKEESDCFARSVLGPLRNFKMRVEDNMGQEIMRMERQLSCFPQQIEIQAPPGIIIGYVRQEWSFLFPTFCVVGPNNEVLLKIQGPFLAFDYCSDINYEVKAVVGGKSIGVLVKQRSDFITKCFNDASNFCVQFPLDLDVKIKALLLGACLFMDILFFDKSGTLFIKLCRGLI